MNAILLFKFIIAHAVADFVLQSGEMGAGKNRHNAIHEQRGKLFPPWYYWAAAHALIHGGRCFTSSRELLLGAIETVLHASIDFAKCEGWINFHVDQGLHVLCKIGYCFAI